MKRVACRHMKEANAALGEVKVLLGCNHQGITAYHDFYLDHDKDDDSSIVICLLMEVAPLRLPCLSRDWLTCDGGYIGSSAMAATSGSASRQRSVRGRRYRR